MNEYLNVKNNRQWVNLCIIVSYKGARFFKLH